MAALITGTMAVSTSSSISALPSSGWALSGGKWEERDALAPAAQREAAGAAPRSTRALGQGRRGLQCPRPPEGGRAALAAGQDADLLQALPSFAPAPRLPCMAACTAMASRHGTTVWWKYQQPSSSCWHCRATRCRLWHTETMPWMVPASLPAGYSHHGTAAALTPRTLLGSQGNAASCPTPVPPVGSTARP